MNYFVTDKQLFSCHEHNICFPRHPPQYFRNRFDCGFLLSIIICLAGGKEIKDCNCFHAILFNMNIFSITTFLWQYMTSSFRFYSYIFYLLWFMLGAQSPIKPKTNCRHQLWSYLFFSNIFFTRIPCEIEITSVLLVPY